MVAALAVVAAAVPGSSASPPSGNPLSAITENPEPADFSQPGVGPKFIPMTDVVAGKTYTLEFSGSITRTNPDNSTVKTDSLYQYERSAEPSFQPTRCCVDFRIQGHEDTLLQPDHYPQQNIPFDTTHEYEATFVPPFTGTLEVRDINRYQQNTTPNSGSVRIELFAGAPGSGGGNPAPTANLPFGKTSMVEVPAPGESADVSSGPMPGKTKQVEMDAQITGAQVDAFAAAMVAAIDKHNKALAKRKQQLGDMLGVCMFFGAEGVPLENLSQRYIGLKRVEGEGILTENFRAKLAALELACKKLIVQDLEQNGAGSARTAAASCSVSIVPIFKRPRERSAAHRAAVAAAKSLLAPSCKSAGRASLDVRVTATSRAGTLNKLLGGRAVAGVARSAQPGAADGPNPQLAVTWRAR